MPRYSNPQMTEEQKTRYQNLYDFFIQRGQLKPGTASNQEKLTELELLYQEVTGYKMTCKCSDKVMKLIKALKKSNY